MRLGCAMSLSDVLMKQRQDMIPSKLVLTSPHYCLCNGACQGVSVYPHVVVVTSLIIKIDHCVLD